MQADFPFTQLVLQITLKKNKQVINPLSSYINVNNDYENAKIAGRRRIRTESTSIQFFCHRRRFFSASASFSGSESISVSFSYSFSISIRQFPDIVRTTSGRPKICLKKAACNIRIDRSDQTRKRFRRSAERIRFRLQRLPAEAIRRTLKSFYLKKTGGVL